MQERTGVSSAPDERYLAFCSTLVDWLDEYGCVLEALVVLRGLPFTDEAVEEILDVPEIRKLRLGWEFWQAVVEGEELDAEGILLESLLHESYLLVREAIWGIRPNGRNHLQSL